MPQKNIWATLHPFFEQGPVMGRKQANAAFLAELLKQDPFPAYHFFIKEQAAKDYLESVLRDNFSSLWEAGRIAIGPVPDLPLLMARYDYGCFHLSDSSADYANVSILRNAFSKRLFPITAPVHTLSYAALAPHLLRMLWEGVAPHDRILATSKTTRQVLASYFQQFRQGYNLPESLKQPEVEQIPLGVDIGAFASPEEKHETGKHLREKLGIGNAVMFLSFSRLSPLSKMDFLPIFDAFEKATHMGLPLDQCCLVIAGHMPDKGLADILTARARATDLRFFLLALPETPNASTRKEIYAAADVFLSPIDNIQETFGLTILEAFASSLPVIASDLDGYSELVAHGEDGLLIPTIGPDPVEGTTALSALLMPDLYHLFFAQQCIVEPTPFAQALLQLGTNPHKRASMGAKGRAKAITYAWPRIIQQHLALWERLNQTPASPQAEAHIRKARHPLIPDYASIFSPYFTAIASQEAIRTRHVRPTQKGEDVLQGKNRFAMYSLLRPIMDTTTLMALLHEAENLRTFGYLSDYLKKNRPAGTIYDDNMPLLWAIKHGYLEFS